MAKKLYQYTVYRTDGTKQLLEPCARKEFRGEGGLYEWADCDTLTLVPKPYFGDGMNKRGTAYCDDNGLLVGKPINPWFKTLADPFYGSTFIVGTVVLEGVFHG